MPFYESMYMTFTAHPIMFLDCIMLVLLKSPDKKPTGDELKCLIKVGDGLVFESFDIPLENRPPTADANAVVLSCMCARTRQAMSSRDQQEFCSCFRSVVCMLLQ